MRGRKALSDAREDAIRAEKRAVVLGLLEVVNLLSARARWKMMHGGIASGVTGSAAANR